MRKIRDLTSSSRLDKMTLSVPLLIFCILVFKIGEENRYCYLVLGTLN